MPRVKRTIARDSVFGSIGGAAPRRGLPQEQPRFQTAVWLGEEEVEWLDQRCLEIRRGGWRGVTRSALIRALIAAAMAKPLDLTGIIDEEGLRQYLSSAKSK